MDAYRDWRIQQDELNQENSMNPNRAQNEGSDVQAARPSLPKRWDELGIEERLERLRTQIQARTSMNNERFQDIYSKIAQLSIHQHLPNGKPAIALDDLRGLLTFGMGHGAVAGGLDPLA